MVAPAYTARMARWRERLYEIIFEADTPAGKAFDVALLLAILLSILAVILESVPSIDARYHDQLLAVEWFFTILFTIEYVLRLICVKRPLGYVFSMWGIIDLLAFLPTYLTPSGGRIGTGVVLRSLRLLRVFRIFKLGRLVADASSLATAVKASAGKIIVFLTFLLTVIVILGATMHFIEGEEAGFTSIPTGMYWAVVTMTTVGYGDIAPQTVAGQIIASVMMILGYSLIVVPAGIVTVEVARSKPLTTQVCPSCTREGHDVDADYCKYCGEKL